MSGQALEDVRVLDLTWYFTGPYCTKILADYGAQVLKVERTGIGDPARGLGPFQNDDPHPEKSAVFFFLNCNKKGITLNLKTALGKKIFFDLVKDTDIVVESFAPGTMESLGLSYKILTELNPKLVMASISNFGQTGPYRDFKATDLILTAMGNEMYSHGLPDLPPLKNPLTRDLIGMGATAAAGFRTGRATAWTISRPTWTPCWRRRCGRGSARSSPDTRWAASRSVHGPIVIGTASPSAPMPSP